EERNYDCGHFKETIFFCTMKRYNEDNPCSGGGRSTYASATGSKCGWVGCDKKIKLRREGPRGKPEVRSLFLNHLLPRNMLIPFFNSQPHTHRPTMTGKTRTRMTKKKRIRRRGRRGRR